MSNDQNTQHPADEAAAAIAAEDAAKAEAQEKDLSDAPLTELENADPEALLKLATATTIPTNTVQGGEGTDTVTGGTPEPAPEPTPEPAPSVIPKPRFDEVVDERNRLKEENARLREEKAYANGRADGATTTPRTTAADPVAKIDADLKKLDDDFNKGMLDLAKKFDDGDLTMTQLREEEQKLKNTTQTVYNTLSSQKTKIVKERSEPTPAELEQRINSNPSLQAATNKIASENPWLNNISDEQLGALSDAAWARAEKEGIAITKDHQGTWKLRYLICHIGKEWGFDKLYAGNPAPAPAPTPAPANAQPPAKTPGITPEQRKAKLDLAKTQPPTPATAGVNAPTDAAQTYNADTMTDVELSTLPKSVLEKMAGLT